MSANTITESELPSQVEDYLAKLTKRLLNYLGDQLVGVYLFGSASCNAYEPGLSDLDVQAVVKTTLSSVEKQGVVSRLTQDALPCPATKLEFVVYTQNAIHPASRHPHFELNLNTGTHQPDHVGLDPGKEASHWFLLDIAMGRQLGRCLYGSDTSEVFGAIPRSWVLEALADSLEWHRLNESSSVNSVLNACRSWRYIASGVFSSKLEGATWAMQQPNCPAVVKPAIAARKTNDKLQAGEVMELYDLVIGANRIQLESENE